MRTNLTRIVLSLLLLVGGCGEVSVSSTTQGEDTSSATAGFGPPEVVVASGATSIALTPFTFCWPVSGNVLCADGIPIDPLPDLGVLHDPLEIRFPDEECVFTAEFRIDPEPDCGVSDCVDSFLGEVTRIDSTTWNIDPPHTPGYWRVFLSGDAPGGTLIAAFAAETT